MMSGGWCCWRNPGNGRKRFLNVTKASAFCCATRRKRFWGYDHQQIAAELLQSWSYPAALVQAVAFHHTPNSSVSRLDAAVVHVADHLVNAMGWAAPANNISPR